MCLVNAAERLHVDRFAPWCTKPHFGVHAVVAAVLAWAVFPGAVLSLISRWLLNSCKYVIMTKLLLVWPVGIEESMTFQVMFME